MLKVKQVIIIGLCLFMFCGVISSVAQAAAKITPEEAKTIALETVNTEEVGDITDVELEDEDGILVYAVEFTKDGIETDVKIDAETGEVVKMESDLNETEEENEDQ